VKSASAEVFLGDKLSADDSPDDLADPATADRVLARMRALLWQVSIAERADGTWEAEITNKEGQESGYGRTRQAALCDAALKASGLPLT
jgi:hypothetical protein